MTTSLTGAAPERVGGGPAGPAAWSWSALSTAARVLVVTGVGSVVAGGLVAAVTDPLDVYRGSWVAAYLVLVCGVGQVCLGLVQAVPGTRALSPGAGWAQLTCWVLGNAAVVVGTLVETPLLVDAGAVLLVVALVAALLATRRDRVGPGPAGRARPLLLTSRVVLVVLVVGAPVGVLLSHLRHGS